jgi:hypothetical protein
MTTNDKVNGLWAKALSAVKSAEKARVKVCSILIELRDNGVSRQDALGVLKGWMESGVFGRTAMFSYLNEVWPTEAKDKKGGRQPDAELAGLAEELLQFAVEEYGEKARSVLLAAWKLSGKQD